MGSLRERLVFDAGAGTVHDGPRRYLLMRPDVLMGMFARLDPALRGAALQAFRASAEAQGGESLAAYFESLGHDGAALLEATAAAAADLGWGRWSFRREGEALHLAVTGSPFAHGLVASAGIEGPMRACTPICGLLAASARLVLPSAPGNRTDDAHGGIEAEELACVAAGQARCEFVARRRAPTR